MEKCVFFWSSCGYTGPPEMSLGLLSSDSPKISPWLDIGVTWRNQKNSDAQAASQNN